MLRRTVLRPLFHVQGLFGHRRNGFRRIQDRFGALLISVVAVLGGMTANTGRAENDNTGTASPSSAQMIPIRLGSVDAVRGGLNLSLPLGSSLPGRMPVGLVWHFDSQETTQFRVGGRFQVAVWPVNAAGTGLGNTAPTTLVQIGATTYTFHRHFAATSGVLSDSDAHLRMTARGVDDGSGEAGQYEQPSFQVNFKQPSSDGTKWYLETNWRVYKEIKPNIWAWSTAGARKIILDGPNAIWTDGSVTHFSNRWGDHVVAQETTDAAGTLSRIRLTNQKSPTEWVQLDVSLPEAKSSVGQGTFRVFQSPAPPTPLWQTPATLATLTVTNGMGLPKVLMKGIYRENPEFGDATSGRPGFIPLERIVDPEGDCVRTAFTWGSLYGQEEVPDVEPGTTKLVTSAETSLAAISHPSELVERFSYGSVGNLSSKAFTIDGRWGGYKIGVASKDAVTDGIANPTSMVGVSAIVVEDGGPGRCVLIVRQMPLITKSVSTTAYTWTQTPHATWVLNYPTATPTRSDPFRGVRIIHPSATNVGANPTSASSYLFATSAALGVERIHGSGAPSDLHYWGSWIPTSFEREQVSVMDGWDIRSWANPAGSLTEALPVTAVATRTSTYTPNLPTRITVAGTTRDAWGPTRTDDYTLPPKSLPSLDGTSVGPWSTSLPGQSEKNIQRTGVITRTWDPVALELVTTSDVKTLSGSDLMALRGVSSVDFGTSTFSHEAGTALLQSTTGTREGTTATEGRSYVSGKPLVENLTKTLSRGTAFATGVTYTYDSSPYQWLASETDKLTGRSTTYNSRNARGQVTLQTDSNGVQIRTDYDAWGRISQVTRLAKGNVGQVATAYGYDPAGRWKTETVTADGRSLTTRTDFDAHGRITKVTHPDGITQETGYDGFGQKIWQTPIMKPGQTPYGNATWVYSAKGLVIAAFDPQSRRLSSAYDPANPSQVWEPQWVPTENGIVTRTWDDRGHLRQEIHDLLGQKKAVIDQAGQRSTYTYNRDGHLIETDQGGQKRTYAYDPQTGWLTSRTEPEEGRTTYGDFTSLGVPRYSQMTGRSDQSNVETLTTLDTWHRPSSITVKNAGTVVTSRTIHYRNDFNVPTDLTESQPHGTLTETYEYDDLGRLNSKSVSDGSRSFSISRVLDASGNVVSLTYPSGAGRAAQTATTHFDALNRPDVVYLDGNQRGQMIYGPGSGTAFMDTLIYANGATTASTMDRGELVSVVHQVLSGLPNNQQVNRMNWTPGGLLLSRGPDANVASSANDTFNYDPMQRLSSARTLGLGGEVATQWFSYDRWGNRTQSDYSYTFPNGGMPKPSELLAWRASYDGRNGLPATLSAMSPGSAMNSTTSGAVTGSLATGTAYDDLGRVTEVNAIPGDAASLTRWGYDPSGRIISETTFGNRTDFLLDGEGLRFKRAKADGSSITYTVYGFNREPLTFFEWTPQVMTGTMAALAGSSLAKNIKGPTTQSRAMAGPALDPVGAYIDAPAIGTTLYVGQAVVFSGSSDFGRTFTWTFGDGTSATGARPTKTFTATGTFNVVLKVSAVPGYSASIKSRSFTVVVAPPAIASFTMSPSTIALGQSSTLNWSVTGATTLKINGTTVTGTSLVVSPAVNTSYTLSATNAGGTVTKSVTVTVVQPPTISGFGASPSSIYQGDGSTLSWNVGGATSLSLDNGIGAVSGTSRVVSPSATTYYTLTATNTVNGVSVSRMAGVTVSVSPRPTVPSITSFTADAAAIASGSGTMLRWNVSNSVGAVVVTITNAGTVTQSGSQSVTPATTTTYTLKATNSLDSSKWVTGDVTVTVVEKPVITFSASPAAVNVGSSSTLTWSVANVPTSVSIDQGIASVAAVGTRSVTPAATTAYTLTASNLAGTVTATATVSVTQKPVIVSFGAALSPINQGSSTTLNWSVQGATSLKLNGTTVTGTSALVSPDKTTTYTLVATNSAGSDTKIATITVMIPESFQWKKTMVYGFGQLISEERPEGTLYVMGDQVGSPNILTNTSGAVVGRSKNLPFGERFWQVGEKSTRRYTNHEDNEGSAIYMQARTYLPAYGKFAQVDPAYDQTKDDPESWNLYNYVTNNPVTHTDPDGRAPTLIVDGVVIRAGSWEVTDPIGGLRPNESLSPCVSVPTDPKNLVNKDALSEALNISKNLSRPLILNALMAAALADSRTNNALLAIVKNGITLNVVGVTNLVSKEKSAALLSFDGPSDAKALALANAGRQSFEGYEVISKMEVQVDTDIARQGGPFDSAFNKLRLIKDMAHEIGGHAYQWLFEYQRMEHLSRAVGSFRQELKKNGLGLPTTWDPREGPAYRISFEVWNRLATSMGVKSSLTFENSSITPEWARSNSWCLAENPWIEE